MEAGIDCLSLVRGTVLLLYGIWMALLSLSGRLTAYVHPRFTVLAAFSGITLVILGLALAIRGLRGHSHGQHRRQAGTVSYVAVLVPLALWAALPVSTLDPNGSASRGYTVPSAPMHEVAAPPRSTPEGSSAAMKVEGGAGGNFYDISSTLYEEPNAMLGQTVEATGFVYRGLELANPKFVLARYMITCCAADASIVGILCECPRQAEFLSNSWVRVKGEIAMDSLHSKPIGVVKVESIAAVEAPKDPYVYLSSSSSAPD